MIASSDTDVSTILPTFSALGLRVAFLVPTDTAIKKSIIDATAPLRAYLANVGSHDYAAQPQGQDEKVLKQTYFVETGSLRQTRTSLYRPTSKDGDPRIWFYDLPSYAEPFNLLAIVAHGDALYVINCSEKNVVRTLQDGTNPLFAALGISPEGLTPEAAELLELLKRVGKQGWIDSMRPGDTGVGFTLETLLGISANSSKTPDYKGVELKSSRSRSSNQTLFSKTPDWDNSRLRSSFEILQARGRDNIAKMRRQLFHSMYSTSENSYGMQLEVNYDRDQLVQFCNTAGFREDDVLWELAVLQQALREKHKQTFWVKSQTRLTGNTEQFRYFRGTYTRNPNVDALPLLLEAGKMFVDYTIREKANGSAKDQGYLFRMKKNNLDLLFGTPKAFNLAA